MQKTELDGTQNRHEHIQIQQRSNKPQKSPRKGLTKIFNQQLTSIHYLYLLFIP